MRTLEQLRGYLFKLYKSKYFVFEVKCIKQSLEAYLDIKFSNDDYEVVRNDFGFEVIFNLKAKDNNEIYVKMNFQQYSDRYQINSFDIQSLYSFDIQKQHEIILENYSV